MRLTNLPSISCGVGNCKQDYFDIVDIPMDFGTIRSNLQNGTKYMNSEDVFNDVEYIWNNCCKYSNEGDYTLHLMKRVRKKFMKYWTAAGLNCKQRRKISGTFYEFVWSFFSMNLS